MAVAMMDLYRAKVEVAWAEGEKAAIEVVTQENAPIEGELYEVLLAALDSIRGLVYSQYRECVAIIVRQNTQIGFPPTEPKPTWDTFVADVHGRLKARCERVTLKLQHGRPTMSTNTYNFNVETLSGGVMINSPGATQTVTNTVTVQLDFTPLRQALESADLPEPVKGAARAEIDKMEAASGSGDAKGFAGAYVKLTSIAADHAQLWPVVAPYVANMATALSQILSG
ncbi:MAG TPA: hypothetical protein VIM61_09335 [Chthoniobacterales bacterium]